MLNDDKNQDNNLSYTEKIVRDGEENFCCQIILLLLRML